MRPSVRPSVRPSARPSVMPSSAPQEDSPRCLTTEVQLRRAIAYSSYSYTSPRRIAICSDILVTSVIPLDNKSFDLVCTLPNRNCQLNAQNKNRIFSGSPVLAKFTKVDFVNANAGADEKGGALFLVGGGTVNFLDSRFFNNRAERGAAMYIDSSKLSVTIRNALFQKNQATVVSFRMRALHLSTFFPLSTHCVMRVPFLTFCSKREQSTWQTECSL